MFDVKTSRTKFAICAIFIFSFLQSCVLAKSTKNGISSTRIPGYDGADIPSFNGYLLVRPENDGHLFYWFVPCATGAQNAPLMIWFNGGPGCTSMVGLFIEHGPFQLYEADKLRENPNSWHKFANVLYIDQPVGVGLSYPWEDNPYMPSSSPQAAQDFIRGMLEFYKLFPGMTNNVVYLSGESYAGKYIPFFYDSLVKQNTLRMNIKGLLIGNAMIKPTIQYGAYPTHGYMSGIIGYKQFVESNIKYEQCLTDLRAKNFENAKKQTCSPMFLEMVHKGGHLSPFDVRELYEAVTRENIIITFLRNPAVMQSLGINSNSKFHKCYALFHRKFMAEFYSDVPDSVILNILNTTKLLLYSGQFDLRVGAYGSSEMLRRLEWPYRSLFNSQPPALFRTDINTFGQFKTVDALSHVVLYGGSHMTPVTRPEATAELVQRFIFQNGNLCPSNSLGCVDEIATCPNKCSNQGNCIKNKCTCNAGFSGLDCSLADIDLSKQQANVPVTSWSTIQGRDAVVYQYRFKPVTSLISVKVLVNRVSSTGLPFAFVNITTSSSPSGAVLPTADFVQRQVRQLADFNANGYSFDKRGFAGYNTSHDTQKIVTLQDQTVYHGRETAIHVAVYNANDYPVNFTISVQVDPSQGTFNWLFVTLAGSLIIAVLIVMEVSVVIQQYNKRQVLLGATNFNRVLLADEDVQTADAVQDREPLIKK